jgi:hypothetical protein
MLTMKSKLSPTTGSHYGTDGKKSSIVTEPRTGLPMNLAYGSGEGGVDGGSTVRGFSSGDYKPNIVIEPRTGLPMNLDKAAGRHGSGGTDGTTPVPDYSHQSSS